MQRTVTKGKASGAVVALAMMVAHCGTAVTHDAATARDVQVATDVVDAVAPVDAVDAIDAIDASALDDAIDAVDASALDDAVTDERSRALDASESAVPLDAAPALDARDSAVALDARSVGDAQSDAREAAVGPEAGLPCPFTRNVYPPLPTLPTINEREYTLEAARWGVFTDASHPVETTQGINRALAWAATQGYGRVRIPAATYLIGTDDSAVYTGGVDVPSNMALVLEPRAVLQMKPTRTWAYCIVRVRARHDVAILGGTLRGDRDTHTFAPGVSLDGGVFDDEAHGICVESESARVLIDGVTVEGAVGDGVLIVANGGDGAHCDDVTIRRSEFARNGRQGVSIVGGVRVLIEDSFLHDTNGASPQFGIDIEGPRKTDRDIIIRRNRFTRNQGGDLVNTDGHNVWFEDNESVQGTLLRQQTDGPVVHWLNTDNVIRRNRITMTSGTVNGRWAILGYVIPRGSARRNPVGNVYEDNTLVGAGINMANNELFTVTGNTITGMPLLAENVRCLELRNNAVSNPRPSDPMATWPFFGRTFMLRNVTGEGSGNVANGSPIELGLRRDVPVSNY